MKKQKGITLIALVVTIIILIILAGVSINLVLGDHGIVTKAKEAKMQYEIAQIEEEIGMKIIEEQAENEGNLSDDRLEDILLEYGDLTQEANIKDRTLTTEVGKYNIKVSDIFDGIIEKGNGPTFTKVANTPDIKGFDKTKTYYVAWNLNEEETEYTPNEKKISENVAPDNWYDYTSGTNHWANIKTTGGGNDCYWVWIPRYAYKISYTNPESRASGTIDIKYLKGTSNVPIGETEEISNKTPGHEKWLVHPAFWWDKNNNGIEEKGEQLTGIWVAKFEASSSAVSEDTLNTDLGTAGGGNVTNLQVRVKPNVTSWRGITLGKIVTVCKNLTINGNSLENTENIDSHLMKNIEWGAVAYLSKSSYGKNGVVWNNPYYNNTTNYSPITGLAGNSQEANQTNLTDTYKYNEIGGGNASASGNVYGIYDMVGGAWEYVAAILSSHKANGDYYDFSSMDAKYYDSYDAYHNKKYGDAVFETSTSSSGTTSWDSDFSDFVNSSYPVLKRGAPTSDSSKAGMFAFRDETGSNGTSYSFRPCLVSLK